MNGGFKSIQIRATTHKKLANFREIFGQKGKQCSFNAVIMKLIKLYEAKA